MSQRQRLNKIIKLLEVQKDGAAVSELSNILKVSEATIRRDLNTLESKGYARRTHGGAVIKEHLPPEPPVLQRIRTNQLEKQKIGAFAASLVEDGETIYIGTGTTALEVAKNLLDRQSLKIVTNSLLVINEIVKKKHTGIKLISLGGIFRYSEQSFIGYIVEQGIKELHPRKTFIGSRAISLSNGLTSDYLPEVSTDRAIFASSIEVIVVADHTKFGTTSTAHVVPLTQVSKFITDDGLNKNIYNQFSENGIKILFPNI